MVSNGLTGNQVDQEREPRKRKNGYHIKERQQARHRPKSRNGEVVVSENK